MLGLKEERTIAQVCYDATNEHFSYHNPYHWGFVARYFLLALRLRLRLRFQQQQQQQQLERAIREASYCMQSQKKKL